MTYSKYAVYLTLGPLTPISNYGPEFVLPLTTETTFKISWD